MASPGRWGPAEPSQRGFGATPRGGHSRVIPWAGRQGGVVVQERTQQWQWWQQPRSPAVWHWSPPGARMGVGKKEERNGAVSG